MYLKIQQKLRCLGCISNQTMCSPLKKTRLNSFKDDFLMKMLHIEIVLNTKQPEAETSLVYDVFIRVIKKRARAERAMREKETE